MESTALVEQEQDLDKTIQATTNMLLAELEAELNRHHATRYVLNVTQSKLAALEIENDDIQKARVAALESLANETRRFLDDERVAGVDWLEKATRRLRNALFQLSIVGPITLKVEL